MQWCVWVLFTYIWTRKHTMSVASAPNVTDSVVMRRFRLALGQCWTERSVVRDSAVSSCALPETALRELFYDSAESSLIPFINTQNV